MLKIIGNLRLSNIRKAIPGGKYGCVSMLRHLYRDELKDIEFGKLMAFVK